MPIYATTNDYYTAYGLTPSTDQAELQRLGTVLLEAADRVKFTARLARYTLQRSTGLPTNPTILEGFKRATLAEARDQEENGAATGEYDSISMAGVTMSKSVRTGATSTTPDFGIRTSQAAVILSNLGIFSTRVGR